MAAATSPQPLVVGEASQTIHETVPNMRPQQSFAAVMQYNEAVAVASSKLELSPVHVIHGEPTVQFTVEEINNFMIEEGMHQVVILKFAYGKLEFHILRQLIPKQLDIKGYCNVGQLEYRHVLVRFDIFEDFVHVLSRSTSYIKSRGDEFFFRTFPWTMGFNSKEETTRSVVWISMPNLPVNLFAKRSLMAIASAVGKPFAVDKATKERSRPSTARVKVLLDLLDKHPKRVKIQIMDRISGKVVEHYQEIVYDNIPKYFTCCKHQGHDERSCRWKVKQNKEDVAAEVSEELDSIDKLQGDARDYINARRAGRLEIEVTTENLNNSDARVAAGMYIDKGPSKIPRDVPSRTALARLSNAVNPIVEAYEKLAAAVKIMSTGSGAKDVNDKEGEQQKIPRLNPDKTDASQLSGTRITGNESLLMKCNGLNVIKDDSRCEKHEKGEYRNVTASKKSSNNRGGSPKRQYLCVRPNASEVEQQKNTMLISDKVDAPQFSGIERIGNKSLLMESNVVNVIEDDRRCDKHEEKEGWNLAASRKSPMNKVGSPKQQNMGVRRNASNIDTSSNAFVVLVVDGDLEGDLIGLNAGKELEQQGTTAGHVKDRQVKLNERGDMGQNLGVKASQIVIKDVVQETGSCKQFLQTTQLQDLVTGKRDRTVMISDEQLTNVKNAKDSKIKRGQLVVIDNTVTRSAATLLHQSHNSNVPTLQFSSPTVEKIIKDTQVVMMLNANPMIKQPVVTLNTSAQEIPSQSGESCGEHGEDSGLQLVDTTGSSSAMATKAWISDQDRALLDTLGSPIPQRCAYSNGSKTTPQKLRAKRHESSSAKRVKKQEPLQMILHEEDKQRLELNLRLDIYKEGEEDELEATIGDLSPKHSKVKEANRGVTLRQLPMRAAKQKGAAPAISTRSNRSEKK